MGHFGAILGLLAILAIIIIIVIGWIVRFIMECVEDMCWRISNWREKMGAKNSHATSGKQGNLSLTTNNNLKKNPQPLVSEMNKYRSGTCEICNREFSFSSSNPDKFLQEITYNFYGKKRTRLICNNCLRIIEYAPLYIPVIS